MESTALGYVGWSLLAMVIALFPPSPQVDCAAGGPCLPGGLSWTVSADTLQWELPRARDEAVELARAARFAEALPRLRELNRRHPEDRQTLVDLIVVLQWAGEDGEALARARGLPPGDLPPYALEALGRAARNVDDPDAAAHFYRLALEGESDRTEAAIGLGYALLEAGSPDGALTVIRTFLDRAPRDPALLLAGAGIHRARGEPLEALRLLNQFRRLGADDREEVRLRALIAADLGAPFQAVEILREDPGLFSPEEVASLLAERAAMAAQWTRVPPRSHERRFEAADRALALLETALSELGELDAFATRRLRFDRVLALRERSRMEEVVEAVEELQREGVELPAYVWQAHGDALLVLGRPSRARESFDRAVAEWPDNTELRISRFHALLEEGDFREALASIDALVEELPAWRQPEGVMEPQANPERLEAEIAAALGRAFTGQLAAAQERLTPLVERAPLNSALRQELAAVYLWRGWSRRALQEYELIIAVDPEHLGARVGLGTALLALDRTPEADSLARGLGEAFPDSEAVRRLRREAAAARGWWLSGEAEQGRSTGGPLGTRESRHVVRLASPLILDGHTRLSLGLQRADARIAGDLPSHDRVGAGLLHARPSLGLNLQVTADRRDLERVGARAEVELRPNDGHRLWFSGDSHSLDVPLQAVLQEIEGWRITAGTERRWSESRRVLLEASWMEMSDGNRREGLYLAGEQRLLTHPAWEISGLLEGFGSRNSREGAPYFNPAWNLSPTGSLLIDWILLRRIDGNFTQRLTLGGGGEWQDGFDARPLALVRYEHRWTRRPGFSLRYGLQWATPSFDGIDEERTAGFLAVDWRVR